MAELARWQWVPWKLQRFDVIKEIPVEK